MNLREITVGRSKNCDIYLDPRCKFASSIHATIYLDGGQLMFKDTSTNGTMINNVNIHKRAVPINRGDIIMLAGQYLLNWNQIDSFFPNTGHVEIGTVMMFPKKEMNLTQQPSTLNKWNWGAFFLFGIWGPFNGCWWALIVYVFVIICSFIPILGILAAIAGLGFQIACGIKGNDWAWNNKEWRSIEDFEHTQTLWSRAGVIVFTVSILLSLISMAIMFSL